ncbi:TetR/AcrR family transcriptional regulator [Muricoccus aerilatus]|uniref:TetR/AcrR family transcriptional regulator n=1 Tax=Muricoccus aerilatus TaxID=452982 RepID=UPI0005C22846|nr:TetR/AcrR family transcriptional regulator [Roseomonas aerilata]
MRVTRAQAAENRARVVEVASRLFRERGFDGVGVDSLMQEAGLTHGGFYRAFGSKEALAAEACAGTLQASAEHWSRLIEDAGPDALAAIAQRYLSPRHRDAPGEGCAFAALAVEAGRRDGPVRKTFSQGLKAAIERLTRVVPGRGAAARREKAIATFAGLVGTLVLARAADDPAFSEEILAAGRKAFGGTD